MPDTSPEPGLRRAASGRTPPGRAELAMLTLRPHARTIAWGGGVLTITLMLGAVGILQSMTTGEPVMRAGTIVDVPSSQSIHLRVRLETGDDVLVPRTSGDRFAEGDAVTVVETTSALSTVGYRLAEADVR